VVQTGDQFSVIVKSCLYGVAYAKGGSVVELTQSLGSDTTWTLYFGQQVTGNQLTTEPVQYGRAFQLYALSKGGVSHSGKVSWDSPQLVFDKTGLPNQFAFVCGQAPCKTSLPACTNCSGCYTSSFISASDGICGTKNNFFGATQSTQNGQTYCTCATSNRPSSGPSRATCTAASVKTDCTSASMPYCVNNFCSACRDRADCSWYQVCDASQGQCATDWTLFIILGGVIVMVVSLYLYYQREQRINAEKQVLALQKQKQMQRIKKALSL